MNKFRYSYWLMRTVIGNINNNLESGIHGPSILFLINSKLSVQPHSLFFLFINPNE